MKYLKYFKTNCLKLSYLLIFFVFLIIPISNITREKISFKENRNFNTFPKLISDGKININFGKNFNEWFNDHFGFRELLFEFHDDLMYNLTTGNYYEDEFTIYNKQAVFSFNKANINGFSKYYFYTKNELNILHDNFVRLKNYCDKNNVKLYVFLSNSKESIYPELYPPYYHKFNNPAKIQQVNDLLKTIPGITVITATDELIDKKKQEHIFLPNDVHMTPNGSYIEYYKLASGIKKDYPFITPIKYSQIKTIPEPVNIHIPKKLSKVTINIPVKLRAKKQNCVLFETQPFYKEYFDYYIFENYKLNYKLKCILIGDSFSKKYKYLMAETFSDFKNFVFYSPVTDFNIGEKHKKVLFKTKPDILIIESVEMNLDRLLNMDSLFDIFDERYVKSNIQ